MGLFPLCPGAQPLNSLKRLMMKNLIWLICLGMFLASPASVLAKPQQEQMKNCNKEAKEKELQGNERKAFMKSCHDAMDAASSEYKDDRKANRKRCKKEAKEKELKGDERKVFMKSCVGDKDKKLESTDATGKGAADESQRSDRREKMKNCSDEAREKGLKGDERRQFMSACVKG